MYRVLLERGAEKVFRASRASFTTESLARFKHSQTIHVRPAAASSQAAKMTGASEWQITTSSTRLPMRSGSCVWIECATGARYIG